MTAKLQQYSGNYLCLIQVIQVTPALVMDSIVARPLCKHDTVRSYAIGIGAGFVSCIKHALPIQQEDHLKFDLNEKDSTFSFRSNLRFNIANNIMQN